MRKNTSLVRLESIQPSRWQPRQQFDAEALRDLARSIGDQGLINPVLVFPENGHYELIAGERRSRAMAALILAATFPKHTLDEWAQRLAHVGLAGLNEHERQALADEPAAAIEATVYSLAGVDDMKALHLLAVTENMDRADLSPVEEARAFQGLMDEYEWTQREMAAHVNKSQGYVAQRLGLLELPAATQEAVSTRVITFAHAREIATLPEDIQEEATGIVAEWVEDGASTRMVEARLKKARNVLNPDRWTAKSGVAYTPLERNRLQILLAASRCPGHNSTQNVLSAATGDGYVLTRSPKDVARYKPHYHSILEILDVSEDEALSLAGMVCDNCIFGGVEPPCEKKPSMNAYCPLLNGAHRTGCENFIGRDDVVAIRAHWQVLKACPEEYKIKIDYDTYITDLDAYLLAFIEANAEGLETEDLQVIVSKQIQGAIADYQNFQTSLGEASLLHAQSHSCMSCAHHCPKYADEGLPTCAYAVDYFFETVGYKGDPRAPGFGVFVNRHGDMVPRCELYSRAESHLRINWASYRGVNLAGARGRVLVWLRTAIDSQGNDQNCVWNKPLSWLPVKRVNGDISTESIISFICEHEDDFGGDAGLMLLVDAAKMEARARTGWGTKPFVLANVETGGFDEWMAYEFPLVERSWITSDWPEDWPKPWEMVKEEDEE